MAFEIMTASAAAFHDLGLKHILVNYNVFERPAPHYAPSATSPRPKAVAAAASGVCRNPSLAGTVAPPAPAMNPPRKKLVLPRLPLTDWPQIWIEQLRKTKRGLIAWTYWNLGSDLLRADTTKEGNARREKRGAIIRRLIQTLGHPAGTHTFWPLHLDANVPPVPNPEVFWSGISELGCRGVIIFGSEGARKVIPDGHIEPLMQIRIGGTFIWIVREIEAIEDQAFYTRMVAYLKSQLQTIIRR